MQKSGKESPVPYIIVTLVLLLAGYAWFFLLKKPEAPAISSVSENSPTPSNAAPAFPPPTSVASGTQVRIDGSTSMVTINHAQVANQQTVRPLAINGVLPSDSSYPYKRALFYVYKNPPNSAVKAFLGYTISSLGQKTLFREN